jgi:hypothetical protein
MFFFFFANDGDDECNFITPEISSSVCHLLSRWFTAWLIFGPEDGDMFLRNVV